MNATLKIVYRATWHWFEIVSGIHPSELETDGGDSIETPLFDAACEAAGVAPNNDPDSTVSRVTRIADRHELIRVGDLLVTDGYGADVVFLREES